MLYLECDLEVRVRGITGSSPFHTSAPTHTPRLSKTHALCDFSYHFSTPLYVACEGIAALWSQVDRRMLAARRLPWSVGVSPQSILLSSPPSPPPPPLLFFLIFFLQPYMLSSFLSFSFFSPTSFSSSFSSSFISTFSSPSLISRPPLPRFEERA